MGRRSMTSAHKTAIRKADATGRTRKADDAHFRLYDWMWRSPAFKALTPAQRCVYVEIEMRYFGHETNNGRIGLSVRQAATACNISKDTAGRCFQRLIELGFIECATPGGFSRKDPHAAEWRLTRARCDVTGAPATKAFMQWKPPAPPLPPTSSARAIAWENPPSNGFGTTCARASVVDDQLQAAGVVDLVEVRDELAEAERSRVRQEIHAGMTEMLGRLGRRAP